MAYTWAIATEIMRQVEAGELTIQDADSGSEDAAI